MHQFARSVAVLLEVDFRAGDAFVHAAAGSDLGLGFKVLRVYHTSFTQSDLATILELELFGDGLDGHGHVVDDDSLLLLRFVLETGRPSLERLEAEGEGVLARREAIALIDHGLIFGEHVPGLEIPHPVVLVGRSLDVLWPMVIGTVVFGFHI